MLHSKITLIVFTILMYGLALKGQVYSDYIGAGHADNIVVTTSSNATNAAGENTINGSGLNARKYEASRFLSQSTLGYTIDDVLELSETLDFESWIDAQVDIPHTVFLDEMWTVYDQVVELQTQAGIDPDDIDNPHGVHFNYTWWQVMMDNQDQLRQRVAHTLSEIMVISQQSQIKSWPTGLSSFHDIFSVNAFGNFNDILTQVSLHPMMGFYLSHLNNSKAIPEENIHPDENYAREIMQLFSIGLVELNSDGSEKLDLDGKTVPTYDQDDIKELAKVFTGLGPGGLEEWVDWTDEPFFGMGIYATEKSTPMLMYENFHEQGEKIILKDLVIPAGQPGMQDVEEAIDYLFNHNNVGPFLALRLIQRLTKSNPTPEYVERVSNVFADNGDGIRGDMKAVIKAILLDDEIRSCAGMQMDNAGKLREPALRYTQLTKAIDTDSPLGNYWNHGYNFYNSLLHLPYNSPTVFNFYLPDHEPAGILYDAELNAPEFQIHNTATATAYINYVHTWTISDKLLWSWEQDFGDPIVRLDTDYYQDFSSDPETMINEYDLVLTHGNLSDETRTIVRDAITPLTDEWDKTRLALYLILISSDYNILR